MSAEPIINLGLLAHVDAGKTTLTERLLHESGAIRLRTMGVAKKWTMPVPNWALMLGQIDLFFPDTLF